MKKLVLAAMAVSIGLIPQLSFARSKPSNIAVIIKATDSDFWQYVIIGAVNYGLDNPDKAKVSWYGPKSEADIEKQVALLDDIVSKKPDAIVIASTSSDSTVPALETAIDEGIGGSDHR